MATHRAIPGANLPESGASANRKGRNSGSDAVPGATSATPASGLGTSVPGESGLGSGMGSGLGAGSDAFGTTGASTTTGDATSTFGSTMGTGRASAGREYPRPVGVVDQVKQQASSRVNEQKARAADGLGSVASAIRQASEHLRTENQTLAAYADTAVDQIQLFADRMRDKDPAEMMQDLEQFARRNPTAFVGGAFLLGLGLARFLKSSGTSAGADTRALAHYDSDFGGRDVASTSLSGTGGYTASDGLARPDDLSRPSGLTTDPSPGITS